MRLAAQSSHCNPIIDLQNNTVWSCGGRAMARQTLDLPEDEVLRALKQCSHAEHQVREEPS